MIKRFSLNQLGRDFVSGDIHGEFHLLEAELERLKFDPARDRLFCVGDLVDRGKNSLAALEWLAKPWFHTCRGNHDNFVHSAPGNVDELSWWVAVNGGDWWLEVDEATQWRFMETFAELPMLLEVETEQGLVGIVHADVPCNMSWAQFARRIENGDQAVFEYALWSRGRAQEVCTTPVEGVYRVYCGHTVFDVPKQVANVYFIDTGAGYDFDGARLTVLPIDTP